MPIDVFVTDEILAVDHHTACAWTDRYESTRRDFTTIGKSRESVPEPFGMSDKTPPRSDHRSGEYADLVRTAKESFKRGNGLLTLGRRKLWQRAGSAVGEL